MIIPKFDTYPAFLAWFAERAEARHLEGFPTPLSFLKSEGWIDDWDRDHLYGDTLKAIRRANETFWALIGYYTKKAPGREVWAWGQPLLIMMSGLGKFVWEHIKSPGTPVVEERVKAGEINPTADAMYDGRVVLFIEVLTGDVLVRSLAEPGNWGYGADQGENTHALVAPTLQFSEANFENHQKALRGEKDPKGNPYKPIPLAEFLDVVTKDTPWVTAHGEGGFFLYRRVRMTWVPVDARDRAKIEIAVRDLGDAGKDFCWISRHVLANARDHGHVNAHLLSCMGLLV